ncbi:MAG: hypothetical protein R3Y63_07120 [Eubacteriales bacterium]
MTIQTAENGTVTMNPSKPKSGETVTLTVTPDEGYEVSEVLVENVSTGEKN